MHEEEKTERQLGKYYTPPILARAMVGWAIDRKAQTVFDPCYGGCDLLRQAVKIFEELGVNNPGKLVFGVDIDPEATQFLTNLFEKGAKQSHFHMTDFLTLEPSQVTELPFDVIVANPPFVRYHQLTTERKQQLEEIIATSGIPLSKRSSYWAYFLIHMIRFLRVGGRLAVILPKAILYTDYARLVKEWLIKQFQQCIFILISDRVFSNTDEQVVLLLCSGHQVKHENLGFTIVEKVSDLGKDCGESVKQARLIPESSFFDTPLITIINSRAAKIYTRLLKRQEVIHLGDVADIRIGIVTGGNHFFILSSQEVLDNGIPLTITKPIITRTSSLEGIQFHQKDFDKIAKNGTPSFLVHIERLSDITPRVRDYIDKGEREGISSRLKCRIRSRWYQISDIKVPDAFLSYMVGVLPRVILNHPKITCTNTIHRLNWIDSISLSQARAYSLSILTSFTQLGSEIEGRSYGGGILKLEPGEARQVPLVKLPASKTANQIFEKADQYIRRKDRQAAIKLADEFVLEYHLQLKRKHIELIRDAWQYLISQRSSSSQIFS